MGRVLGRPYTGDVQNFSDEEHDQLIIVDDRLYKHKTIRINYTTYDLRREQDSINPSTSADVMVLANEYGDDAHPYWYARVICIFHAIVHLSGASGRSNHRQVDLLYVRWFARVQDHTSGFPAKRSPKLTFFDGADEVEAFGFVDPSQVIRGVHLLPSFNDGQTDEILPPSFARHERENNMDWNAHYVNM